MSGRMKGRRVLMVIDSEDRRKKYSAGKQGLLFVCDGRGSESTSSRTALLIYSIDSTTVICRTSALIALISPLGTLILSCQAVKMALSIVITLQLL